MNKLDLTEFKGMKISEFIIGQISKLYLYEIHKELKEKVKKV